MYFYRPSTDVYGAVLLALHTLTRVQYAAVPRARAPVPPRMRVGASFSPRSSRERKSTPFGNAFLVTPVQDSHNAEGLLPVKRYGTARASFRDARSRATRRAEERAKKENSKKKNRTP